MDTNVTNAALLNMLQQTQADLQNLRETVDHSWIISRAFAVLAMVSWWHPLRKLRMIMTCMSRRHSFVQQAGYVHSTQKAEFGPFSRARFKTLICLQICNA